MRYSNSLRRFAIGDGVVDRRSYRGRSTSSSFVGTSRSRQCSAREEELVEKMRQMEQRMTQYQQNVTQQLNAVHSFVFQQEITRHSCSISKLFN